MPAKIGRPSTWQSGCQFQDTKTIRVPKAIAPQLLEIARQLDAGTPIATSNTIDPEHLSLVELTELAVKIKELIEKRREAERDKRLEDAIVYLAGHCNGAYSTDGTGYNKADTSFGHWLANRIKKKEPLLRKHASLALGMVRKYKNTQLTAAGIILPSVEEWQIVREQYPETLPPPPIHLGNESEPKLLQMVGNEIALISPYDPEELKKIKAIEPKGRFNGNDKSWRFPLGAAVKLLATFTDYQIDPNVEGQALIEEQIEAEKRKQLESRVNALSEELIELLDRAHLDSPLPNGKTPFKHQREAVEWLLARKREGILPGGILADHMGLGKTMSALLAAKTLGQSQGDCPIFVICPASLRENWAIEAAGVGTIIETFSWAKLPKPLLHSHYILIADEAHYAQNPKAQRTKTLLELAGHPNCLATWLLTGTPIKNGRPINLFPLLAAIDHPLAQNRSRYERYYCNAGYRSIGHSKSVWDNSGAAHLDELAKETENCILRRTKADCLDLPQKQRIFTPVQLEGKQEDAYDAEIKSLVQSYRDRVKRKEVDPDAEALVTLNYLRKIGSKYKVDPTIEVVEELMEQGQQAVIFVEYLESANQLRDRLQQYGVELLTGSTPTQDRQKMVERFQSGSSKIFIGTIKAGGVGITLTAASTVILVDRPWTPGDAEQAEDRLHRIGQHHPVSAIWLQMGFIDSAIDNLLLAKQERIELVLKGKRKTLKGIDSPKELALQLLELL